MDAADEASDPFQHLRIVEVRRSAAAAGIDREKETPVLARVRRRDHRDLALGTVELEHARRALLEPDLVDAVLVAVQRQQAPVGPQARRFARVEHDFRGERGVRMRHGGIVDAWAATTSKWRGWASPTAISRSSAACRSSSPREAWWRSSAAAARASRRCSS